MKKHKVLLVHNHYQIPGGEDTVVANERKLLEEHGHEVLLYTRHNAELNSMNLWRKMLLPFCAIFNIRTYREVKKIIRRESVDIVHVHNTLTLISPSVYYAAAHCKVPVVQTIHNFRMLCPGATFYRDGHICEDCLNKGLGCAIRHGCYRGSKVQTLACVLNAWIHRTMGIYRRLHYICLTEFNKQKLLQLKQLREDQISIKPNFVGEAQYFQKQRTNRIIFVGRLEKLKGVDLLLEAWKLLGKDAPELLLCGTGPLEHWCREYNLNVTMKGFVPNTEVRRWIGTSRALILPTQCYEGLPMTIVEAFSQGTPVITGDIGNGGAVVEDGKTGVKFRYHSAQALAEAVKRFETLDGNALQENTLREYEKRYSPEGNYRILLALYDAVIQG